PPEDLFALLVRPSIEIVRQVPCDATQLRRRDVGRPMSGRCSRGMGKLCLEVAFGKSISSLDAAEDLETRHRLRRSCALDPGHERLVIEPFVVPNDSAAQVPRTVAVAIH